MVKVLGTWASRAACRRRDARPLAICPAGNDRNIPHCSDVLRKYHFVVEADASALRNISVLSDQSLPSSGTNLETRSNEILIHVLQIYNTMRPLERGKKKFRVIHVCKCIVKL